jgi:response regulator RpfG family c-di-GMP phosphodiesterase
VLCVDDEPHVLEGLALHLRRSFEVLTALSGVEALGVLSSHPRVAVVMSDMRMPGMDGAAFLSKARTCAPDATRLLLTGHADVQAAVSAVNQGQIFRFLTKPCPPQELRAALDAAVEQHRLITSEKVLLEQTLVGAVKALSEVLSLTSPLVFGRSTRVRELAQALSATASPTASCWALDSAAMLGALGLVTVPDEVLHKVSQGQPLSAEERAMLARAAELTDSLLANIPRLETVRTLVSQARVQPSPGGPPRLRDAEVLRAALDFDALETELSSASAALATMRGRNPAYDAEVLAALTALRGGGSTAVVREVRVAQLREDMVCSEDVRTAAGLLLVSRGFRVTANFITRLRNFGPGYVKEPLRVHEAATPVSPR